MDNIDTKNGASAPLFITLDIATADELSEHFTRLIACAGGMVDTTYAESARKIFAVGAAETITEISNIISAIGTADLRLPAHDALTEWMEQLARLMKTLDDLKDGSNQLADEPRSISLAVDRWYGRAELLIAEYEDLKATVDSRYGD